MSHSARSASASYASPAAFCAALFFALHLATYFVPSIRDATLSSAAVIAGLLAVLALAQHLVVFPVVAALPAPRWARLAGYTWLVVDMLTDPSPAWRRPQNRLSGDPPGD